MIVDMNEESMRPLLPLVKDAQIADCTKEDVLRSLGVNNFDICFVCIGDNFQSSLEITSLLKDLGAKYVISKAKRDIHKKFLLRNGADEVTYPERDIAEKLAVRHSASNLFDYFELTKEISIYEIPALKCWIGKSIKEMNFRTKYNISILATKNGETVTPLPSPNYVFNEDEHLMVMGHHLDVEKILKQL
jgi:trk system potassium uptake protein TrkA